jgi:serine protease Do
VFPARDAVSRLVVRAATDHSTFGIAVQGLDGRLTAVFGDRGVIVTDTADGGPAAEAGVEPGDVLVGIGDVDVISAGSAAMALDTGVSGQPTTFRLVRQGRERTVEVSPVPAYNLASVTPTPAVGPSASAVLTAEERDALGLAPSAVVLQIDGVRVTSVPQAQRLIRQRRSSVPILISRDGVRLMTVLPALP